jgi:hypothetical protein
MKAVTVSEKETRAYGAGMPSERELEELAFRAQLRLVRERKAALDRKHKDRTDGHGDR